MTLTGTWRTKGCPGRCQPRLVLLTDQTCQAQYPCPAELGPSGEGQPPVWTVLSSLILPPHSLAEGLGARLCLEGGSSAWVELYPA